MAQFKDARDADEEEQDDDEDDDHPTDIVGLAVLAGTMTE